MSITTSTLNRAAGIAAALAGLIYIVIQFIHPADELASLTTGAWVGVHSLSFGMAVLGLVGVTGIYLRQVKQFGVLGLIGYVMFGMFFVLQAAFTFAEAFIMPLVAQYAPQYAEGFAGMFGRHASEVDLGPVATVVPVGSALYIVGALIFGIAVIRARVLSRGAGILLIAAAVVTPIAGALLPHTLERMAAIPMGLALIWLGYSLWADQRKNAVTSMAGSESSHLDRTPTA